MVTLLFVAFALALFGISYYLIKRNSLYTRKGGDAYVKRQKRKLVGVTLLFPAGLLLVLAVVSYVASNPASLPADTVIATEPYVPPVLSKPSADDPIVGREAPMRFTPPSGTASSRSPENLPLTLTDLPASSGTAREPDPLLPATSQAPKQTPDEKFSSELAKLNATIKADPKNADAYGEMGNIYANQQSWMEAETNYRKALELDDTNSSVKYNLAQMQFVQKKYDMARPGFVAIQKDNVLGDLALYKTFLCDLYGGHDDMAAKELDAFNQAGENASYYFANIAWSLYHKKTDDAQDWLASANRIYAPQKVALYSADLYQLGYLPLATTP